MQGKRGRKLIAPLAVVTLGVAAVAWGHGFGRGGFGGPEGPGGHGGPPGGPRGLFQRLVFPCQTGCFDTAKTCFEPTESAVDSCVTAACAAQITAAQSACQADRRSSDCRTALGALRTCAQPCVDSEASAVSTCRDALDTCLNACGNT
jgi:hypothetical protein